MKQGRTLPEVMAELKRQNKEKRDFICPAPLFRLEDDGQTFGITNTNTGVQESFGTTNLSLSQTDWQYTQYPRKIL